MEEASASFCLKRGRKQNGGELPNVSITVHDVSSEMVPHQSDYLESTVVALIKSSKRELFYQNVVLDLI